VRECEDRLSETLKMMEIVNDENNIVKQRTLQVEEEYASILMKFDSARVSNLPLAIAFRFKIS
jgi:hypothetical protein